MAKKRKVSEKHCMICGKTEKKAKYLIQISDSEYLCRTCINELKLFSDQYDGEERMQFEVKDVKNIDELTPAKIKDKLDEYVIGQDDAKEALALGLHYHNKAWEMENTDGAEVEKNNILLIGDTGTGKTLLVKTLAKIANVPLVITDATSYTVNGYVGKDVDSMITDLYEKAGRDVDLCEHGIIYIDEVDKIAAPYSEAHDIDRKGVQQALLKLMEGTIIGAGPRRSDEKTPIHTDHILFICGGAFSGLDDIIKERQKMKRGIGFSAGEEECDLSDQILTEDLVKYGMEPEFVGRLPILARLEPMTKQMLRNILVQPKDSVVKQYEKLFQSENAKLRFTDGALDVIAEEALNRHTGARGLRSIVQDIVRKPMFEIPSIKVPVECVVDKKSAKEHNGKLQALSAKAEEPEENDPFHGVKFIDIR